MDVILLNFDILQNVCQIVVPVIIPRMPIERAGACLRTLVYTEMIRLQRVTSDWTNHCTTVWCNTFSIKCIFMKFLCNTEEVLVKRTNDTVSHPSPTVQSVKQGLGVEEGCAGPSTHWHQGWSPAPFVPTWHRLGDLSDFGETSQLPFSHTLESGCANTKTCVHG